MFDLEKIKNQTAIATLDYHQSIESTNTRALELVKQSGTRLPGLVLTEIQISGRGQRSHKWFSTTGSLTFSWIASFAIDGQPQLATQLPLASALAVVTAVEQTTALSGLQIKWPNDVMAKRQKLAGILIESVIQNARLDAVIGIGINVNNELSSRDLNSLGDRADQPLTTPTSIWQQTNQTTEPTELLIAIVNRLHQICGTPDKLASHVRQCNDRLLHRGRSIIVTQNSLHTRSGVCEGVDDYGRLRLKTSNSIELITSGSIGNA